MLTPNLCRAARHLIGWKQEDLAEKSELAVNTIRMFEGGKTKPHKSTLKLLRETFEAAGVEFLIRDGRGVGLQLRVGYGET